MLIDGAVRNRLVALGAVHHAVFARGLVLVVIAPKQRALTPLALMGGMGVAG